VASGVKKGLGKGGSGGDSVEGMTRECGGPQVSKNAKTDMLLAAAEGYLLKEREVPPW